MIKQPTHADHTVEFHFLKLTPGSINKPGLKAGSLGVSTVFPFQQCFAKQDLQASGIATPVRAKDFDIKPQAMQAENGGTPSPASTFPCP